MAERFDFNLNRWVSGPTTHLDDLPAPAVPPRPGAWIRPPARSSPAARFTLAATIAAGIVMAVSAILSWSYAMIGAMWAGIVLFITHAFLIEDKRRPGDDALLENPGDTAVCLVTMRVSVDGRSVGKDTGAAWLADGKLVFSGRRTSFALGGEDLLPRREWPGDYDMARTPGVVLPLRAEGRRLLFVQPLPGGTLHQRQTALAFREALVTFRNHPLASDGHDRQWPPFG